MEVLLALYSKLGGYPSFMFPRRVCVKLVLISMCLEELIVRHLLPPFFKWQSLKLGSIYLIGMCMNIHIFYFFLRQI